MDNTIIPPGGGGVEANPQVDPLRQSAEQVKQFLATITAGVDRAVIELRALGVPRRYGSPITRAGFFDLPTARKEFLEAVKSLLADTSGQPDGVYVTLNPLTPDLLARASNRLKDVVSKQTVSASDKDVSGRHHLLIDVDPKRLAGVCATDAEKAAARAVFDVVREEMRAIGFCEPALVIDSGNGFHGWYRIDLPRDDGGKVERLIKWLAARHNTAAATIDTSVFNPARITRLPGSWNRKGDSVPDRPHRLVTILETPCERTSPPPT